MQMRKKCKTCKKQIRNLQETKRGSKTNKSRSKWFNLFLRRLRRRLHNVFSTHKMQELLTGKSQEMQNKCKTCNLQGKKAPSEKNAKNKCMHALTTGTCKIEYILQSPSFSRVVEAIAKHTSSEMRKTLATILRATPAELDDETWALVALPMRMGGFGLRDPTVIVHCARLAAAVNLSVLAAEMGANEAFLALEREQAVSLYRKNIELTVRPELQPSRELQKQLTMPLHSRTAHQLLSIAEPTTKACLESLMTPHATAWFACAPLVRVLAPSESVAATRRNLGLKLVKSLIPCTVRLHGRPSRTSCHNMPALRLYNKRPQLLSHTHQ